MNEFYKAYTSLPVGNPMREGIAPFLRRLAGPDVDSKLVSSYDLLSHIDSSYPKTYIVANEDDGTVPVANSKAMDAVLTKLGVEHITRIGSKGGHSFGLGNGLEVSGWLEEAVDFWRGTTKNI
jgi:acetyl esterase/lipase